MLERLKQQVSPFLKARRWYIAYSGGLDSHVLLHLLAELRTLQCVPEIIAVHVNHQLQPEADAWQQHCQAVCCELDIPLHISCVTVANSASLEQAARDARYRAFEDLLTQDDLLLMAHHGNDQAETLLYRLFRGSGLKGLAGMPVQRPLGRGALLRPLLMFGRSELQAYAEQQKLTWIDDPSNGDRRFDRNYIRTTVLPAVVSRWPQAVKQITRAGVHLMESQQLLDELAQMDLVDADRGNDGESWLDCTHLLSLSSERLRNSLRYWLSTFDLFPSTLQLQQLLDMLLLGNDNRAELVLGATVMRCYQQRLYLSCRVVNPGFPALSWQATEVCQLGAYGRLRLSQGLDLTLQVKPREGGESCRLQGNQHTRKLKQLLQELQVPPWRRENIPLIYYQGELLAVADLIRCEAADKVLQHRKIIVERP